MTLTQKRSSANAAIISDPNSSEKVMRRLLEPIMGENKKKSYRPRNPSPSNLLAVSDISELLAVTNASFKQCNIKISEISENTSRFLKFQKSMQLLVPEEKFLKFQNKKTPYGPPLSPPQQCYVNGDSLILQSLLKSH